MIVIALWYSAVPACARSTTGFWSVLVEGTRPANETLTERIAIGP